MDRRIVVISTSQMAFLVNGKANDQFEHYFPKDGDRILIIYGDNGNLHNQLDRLNSTKILTFLCQISFPYFYSDMIID
jgi:hypothetical protein